jgi:hypothetical protein
MRVSPKVRTSREEMQLLFALAKSSRQIENARQDRQRRLKFGNVSVK